MTDRAAWALFFRVRPALPDGVGRASAVRRLRRWPRDLNGAASALPVELLRRRQTFGIAGAALRRARRSDTRSAVR